MLVREIVKNAETGEFTDHLVEVPGVLTEEEAKVHEAEQMRLVHNAEIELAIRKNATDYALASLEADEAQQEVCRQRHAELRSQIQATPTRTR